MSKAVKKILAKCRISGGKGKSKMGSPICGTLRPVDFQFSEVLLIFVHFGSTRFCDKFSCSQFQFNGVHKICA